MIAWRATALAFTLMIYCSTNAHYDLGADSSRVSDRAPPFWIGGFERPLNVLRVEDAREFHAVWSRALASDAALPVHSPPYLVPNEEVSAKNLEQALAFMLATLEHALGRAQRGQFRDEDVGQLRQVAEVHRALELVFKDPVRRKRSLELEIVKRAIALGTSSMLRGEDPAINAEGAGDPANSSFWTRPQDISWLDLRIGFGRKLTLADEVRNQDRSCAFDEPKTGYGTNPGSRSRAATRRSK
jgi:hypothetical protein